MKQLLDDQDINDQPLTALHIPITQTGAVLAALSNTSDETQSFFGMVHPFLFKDFVTSYMAGVPPEWLHALGTTAASKLFAFAVLQVCNLY
jgi:hypothetical protein